MANSVKRMETRGLRSVRAARWSARTALTACLALLVLLATQLPDPVQVVSVLVGSTPSPVDAAAPLAAVQSILLITAGLIGWLVLAWTLAVVAIGLMARLPGRPGRRARRLLPRIAPASFGRLVAAALGVSLIAGTAACAVPGTSSAAPSTSSVTATTGSPTSDGSITIDWPDPATVPAPPPQAGSAGSAEPGGAVVVQPGDSLWRIAERALGPGATDAEVDNAWRAWYFVNRSVIGDDPDLIAPGQSLVAPAADPVVDR